MGIIKEYANIYSKKWQYAGRLKAIRRWKNAFPGKRCFIIGNGPSLRTEDLDKIKDEYTFAANRIYKIFPKTCWRPTFHCISDSEQMGYYLEEAKGFPCTARFLSMTYLLINHKTADVYDSTDNLFYEYNYSQMQRRHLEFSKKLENGIACGNTITFIMIQIAVYMGFQDIYIIGCDHSVPQSMGEKTHFYNDQKADNHVYSFEKSTIAYKSARKYADSHDVRIWNATRGGCLKEFQRVNFDQLSFLNQTTQE